MGATETVNDVNTTSPEVQVLNEGYGPGAWHGPDLKAALSDVDATLAFWRPSPARHNIAEIALHHAFVVRSVRAQISGEPARSFILEGKDWFALSGNAAPAWATVLEVLDTEQRELEEIVRDVVIGRHASPIDERERFKLVLGLTCHAVYHAGQVQLIKRLHTA